MPAQGVKAATWRDAHRFACSRPAAPRSRPTPRSSVTRLRRPSRSRAACGLERSTTMRPRTYYGAVRRPPRTSRAQRTEETPGTAIRREDPDDGHHDHQLDQRETRLGGARPRFERTSPTAASSTGPDARTRNGLQMRENRATGHHPPRHSSVTMDLGWSRLNHATSGWAARLPQGSPPLSCRPNAPPDGARDPRRGGRARRRPRPRGLLRLSPARRLHPLYQPAPAS